MRIFDVDIKTVFSPARLTIYLHEEAYLKEPTARDMILVIPGGAYAGIAPLEGEPVCTEFFARGFNTAFLRYSVKPSEFPEALTQLAMSVAHLRENALEYNINPQRIFINGFSAGGHLAASLGTLWHHAFLKETTGLENECFMPNGMILAYPVITSGEYAHRDSINNLLGKNADDEKLLTLVSLEKQVSEKTVPTFIWTTAADNAVPAENTLMFIWQLQKYGILYESLIFPQGKHGLAIGTKETFPLNFYGWDDFHPEIHLWVDRAVDFLTKI